MVLEVEGGERYYYANPYNPNETILKLTLQIASIDFHSQRNLTSPVQRYKTQIASKHEMVKVLVGNGGVVCIGLE